MSREAIVKLDDSNDILEGLLHYDLFAEAERVRWRMEDIPWASVDQTKVTPGVLAMVRQLALGEMTTYPATRRFLQDFSDDIDFTQWMSVWFYEETKHPHALVRWLHEVGESFSAGEMIRGRITAPFMKSRFGMLVTNVISEVHASAGYIALSRATEEPVLKQVARNIAGDEARHAMGFFVYAKRALESSSRPEETRLEALKVLHMWLSNNTAVQHPVNTVGLRTSSEQGLLEEVSRATGDQTVLDHQSVMQQRLSRQRALSLIGNLTGVTMKSPDEIVDQIRDLTLAARTAPPKGRGQHD